MNVPIDKPETTTTYWPLSTFNFLVLSFCFNFHISVFNFPLLLYVDYPHLKSPDHETTLLLHPEHADHHEGRSGDRAGYGLDSH
jgi:hypothetical protein